ncbi:MAG: hypothetical protein KY447_11175 [Actinobacteria bacterium]|nr:hypothetical protein [Actinomycetota bacterium]MBW3643464.1 hypothetical protein [Actinomycetota bacterium]
MARDPYVSAVVHLTATTESDDQPPVDDPDAVAAQGAAVLAGAQTAPISQWRHANPRQIPVPASGSPAARVRGYFTSAGFEVHAPLGRMFSIGAARSRFESFFETSLVVDEHRLGGVVTTESGAQDLPVQGLPEQIQQLVVKVSFPQPPELPGG